MKHRMPLRRRSLARALAMSAGVFAVIAPLPLGQPGAPAVVRAADDDEKVPAKVEAAVDKALPWLAKTQKPDGPGPQGQGASTAVPALAAKAFLARGHIPGQGPYGENINKAIDYVLEKQQPDGL